MERADTGEKNPAIFKQGPSGVVSLLSVEHVREGLVRLVFDTRDRYLDDVCDGSFTEAIDGKLYRGVFVAFSNHLPNGDYEVVGYDIDLGDAFQSADVLIQANKYQYDVLIIRRDHDEGEELDVTVMGHDTEKNTSFALSPSEPNNNPDLR